MQPAFVVCICLAFLLTCSHALENTRHHRHRRHVHARHRFLEDKDVESRGVVVCTIDPTTNLNIDTPLAKDTASFGFSIAPAVADKTTVKFIITPQDLSTSMAFTTTPAGFSVKGHCIDALNAKQGDCVEWTNGDTTALPIVHDGNCAGIVITITCAAGDFPNTATGFTYTYTPSTLAVPFTVLGYRADRVTPFWGTTAVTTARQQLADWNAFWTGISGLAAPAPVVAVNTKVINLGHVNCLPIKQDDLAAMTKVEITIPDDDNLLKNAYLGMTIEGSANSEYIMMFAAMAGTADPLQIEYEQAFFDIKAGTAAYSAPTFTLYFSATRFASQTGLWRTGMATLSLYINDVVVNSINFFVAPWLASSTDLPITKMYMFNDGTSTVPRATTVATVTSFINTETARTDRFIEVIGARTTWTQDVFESGYNRIGAVAWPATRLSPRLYTQIGNYATLAGSSQFTGVDDLRTVTRDIEAGGNIEATPPSGRWPLGRIVVGSWNPDAITLNNWMTTLGLAAPPANLRVRERVDRVMSPQSLDFFADQGGGVQTPIELYSNWLGVGHIDEMVTFVPTPGELTGQGFVILMAWPDLFFTMLEAGRFGADTQAVHVQYDFATTIGDIKSGASGVNYARWKAYNAQITYFQQKNMDRLKTALSNSPQGLPDQYFVKVPLPFIWGDTHNYAQAVFPDTLNMIVGTKRVLLPNPFFKATTTAAQNGGMLDAINLTIKQGLPNSFEIWQVDDHWAFQKHGDIHCLTNTLRDGSKSANWWAKRPG